MRTAHAGRDRRRAGASGPPQRARACRTALPRWFYRQRIAQARNPATPDFAQDARASWEGNVAGVHLRDQRGYRQTINNNIGVYQALRRAASGHGTTAT